MLVTKPDRDAKRWDPWESEENGGDNVVGIGKERD